MSKYKTLETILDQAEIDLLEFCFTGKQEITARYLRYRNIMTEFGDDYSSIITASKDRLIEKMRCCGNCSKQGRKCKTISNFPVNFCGAWEGFKYD